MAERRKRLFGKKKGNFERLTRLGGKHSYTLPKLSPPCRGVPSHNMPGLARVERPATGSTRPPFTRHGTSRARRHRTHWETTKGGHPHWPAAPQHRHGQSTATNRNAIIATFAPEHTSEHGPSPRGHGGGAQPSTAAHRGRETTAATHRLRGSLRLVRTSVRLH